MVRGLIVWLLIMLLETVHGILRGILLVPRLGEEAAQRIGWPVGLFLVLAVTTLMIRWTGVKGSRPLLKLGAVWAVLSLGFEILIGLARGLDGGQILTEVNPMSGLVLYSAAVMLLAPLSASRLRR